MEIKIAHCADVHLGADCKKLKNFSDIRRAEIKNSFFNMLNKVDESGVDFLLIAGDLFHDVDVYSAEVKEVKEAFRKMKCQVVISPGNHDPFTVNSPYYDEWPANVHIFKDSFISYFQFEKFKTRIWGSAFTPRNASGAREIPDLKDTDEFINILLIHGTCPPSKDDMYNPVNISEIGRSGMDYVALGHIHKRTPILKEENTFYAYSGCMEGRGFKELGEKGFYLGTLSKRACNLAFTRAAKRLYLEVSVDITGFKTSVDICESIIANIKENFGDSYAENAYRVFLQGLVSDDAFVDISYIKSKLKEKVFFAEVQDRTEIFSNSSENNLRSIFVKNMKKYIESCCDEEEKKIAEKALKLGILSFSREVKYNED